MKAGRHQGQQQRVLQTSNHGQHGNSKQLELQLRGKSVFFLSPWERRNL